MGRGRRRSTDGPTVTTTVRLPVSEWEWVKKNGHEFTSLLRRQIRTAMAEAETEAARLYLRSQAGDPLSPQSRLRDWLAERNRKGLTTSPEDLAAKRTELGL